MTDFFSGMIAMGFLVAGVLLLRLCRRTDATLLAVLGLSLLFFALNHALTALAGFSRDEQGWFYLLRLAGYTLLIVGIVRKNWTRTTQRAKTE